MSVIKITSVVAKVAYQQTYLGFETFTAFPLVVLGRNEDEGQREAVKTYFFCLDEVGAMAGADKKVVIFGRHGPVDRLMYI